ncbi:MAG TPA: hypothetical protein VEJ18_20545 [Planctomycetota bacterium]|nr:hypothetical protein [Planctomycetota bacterium]
MTRSWGVPASIAALAVAAGVAVFLARRPQETVERPSAPRPSDPVPALSEAAPASEAVAPPAPKAARTRAASAFEGLLEALRGGDRAKIQQALDELYVELVPPPVPDAENAALLYKKAFEKYQGELSDEEADILGRLSEHGHVTPDERAKLQALLDRNREALELLHQAAGRAKCNFNLDYTQGFRMEMPHIEGLIRGAKLLNLEALLAGKDGPAGSSYAALRLAEAVADEPVLVSQLVRVVCHGIGNEARQLALAGDVGRDHLLALVQQFAPDRIRASAEKTLLLELYSGVKLALGGDPAGVAPGVKIRRPDDPLGSHDLSLYAETLGEYAALAGRPYHEVRDRLQEIQTTTVNGAPWYAEMTRQMLPSLAKAAERQAVAEATLGTGQLAAALKLYQQAHGAYPASLDALQTLLPALPVDPFTGRPYVYRREGSGFVVYSVGSDGADGGGVLGEFGEADVVFRVPR